MTDVRRQFYVSVLSQALSPCEGFLAAGTNFGNVNIFNLSRLYEPDSVENEVNNHEAVKHQPLPYKYFSVSSKPLQGMVSSNDHLIVGGKNCIQGYNWDQLILSKASQNQEPSWCVDLHLPTDFGSKETVDCIILDGDSSAFAACGDNNAYNVDLEYGKVKSSYTGHSDFIHSMSLQGTQLCTASEDGTVCIWDTRKPKPVHTITPHLDTKLARPKLGKWIGAVAMNEDWLVCGGGPHLALYHLRSLTMSKVLLDDDSHPINCVMFNEDSIIVGVDGPIVYHVLFSGDVTVKMPTTPLRIYSLCIQKKDLNKILAVGGASSDIDICAGSKLQDQIVRCVS